MKTLASLGQPLALGRTAEVYAWAEGQIVKLFYEWCSINQVENEALASQVAHDIGVPTPALIDQLNIEGRMGLVYDQVIGQPMLALFENQPQKIPALMQQLADLHQQLHTCLTSDLPSLHQRLTDRITTSPHLPAETQATLLTRLDQLPDGEALCHNDFHPGNVLLTEAGSIIIDWSDAARGNPLADVARTSFLMTEAELPPELPLEMRDQIQAERQGLNAIYLTRYAEIESDSASQITLWRPVILAARLSENVSGERERLLALIEAELQP